MELAESSDTLFRRIDGRYAPTELAAGPWSKESLHGSAVAALVVHAAEANITADPLPSAMRVTRITLDLTRAVPMQPLLVVVDRIRLGRRVGSLRVTVSDGERTCTEASVLLSRERAGSASEAATAERSESMTTRAGEGRGLPPLDEVPGFLRAIDYRSTRNKDDATVETWIRLRCQVVQGAAPSPAERLAAAADFTSGSAVALDYTRWLFVNPDLSIFPARYPRGEWVGIRSDARIGADGIGQAHGRLFDAEGWLGLAQASMIVEQR